jgi:hypothetical protein
MKKKILNIRYQYILLISISLFQFFSIYAVENYSGDDRMIYCSPVSFSEIQNSDIFTYDNRKYNFNSNDKYLVVLKNNKYCNECFVIIDNYVKSIRKEIAAKFICISLIDSTTLGRKRNYAANRNLLANFDEYYFQYTLSTTGTLFKKFNSNYTPEILIINNGNVIYIPYSEIYDSNYENIGVNTQYRILQFLK